MATNKKVICYICADMNTPACLRKLSKFTTCAKKKGFDVSAVWPGYAWYSPGSEWKLDFFRVFNDDDFCAVVVDCEFGFNPDILSKQAQFAREHGLPFVVMDMDVPGAISVRFDDEEMFREILDHAVSRHGAREIFFAGDLGHPHQINRYLQIYKEFLKKENIPFDEKRVMLCDTSIGKGKENIETALRSSKPDAVVCTSSVLGTVVCGIAPEAGYSVPGDLIVMSINGIHNRRTGIPDVSAGNRNLTLLSDKILNLIDKALKEEEVTGSYLIPMDLYLSESCGCDHPEESNLQGYVRSLVYQRTLAISQERRQHSFFPAIQDLKDVESARQPIREILPDDTFFCIRDSFAEDVKGAANIPTNKEKFHVFASADPGQEGICFDQSYLHKLAGKQSKNVSPLIIYPVYIREEIYGFVVGCFTDFVEKQQMMGRFMLCLCRTLSFFVRNVEVERSSKKLSIVNENYRNAQLRDPMTGLYNSSGLMYELEKVKKICIENKEKLYYICVDLDHLSNINDIYGHNEGDCAIIDLAEIIKECVSKNEICAHLGSDEFIIFTRITEGEDARSADSLLRLLKNHVADYNNVTDKEYTLNINTSSGMLVVYEDTDMPEIVDEALSNKRLLKNNRRSIATTETDELGIEELKYQDQIEEVLNENKFRYAFQPIVNAVDGSIFGYEALMRPESRDFISPLTILKYAAVKQRLYDVERLTFFNVFRNVEENRAALEGKKIFLNSIPGFQIDQADFEVLKKKYHHLMKDIFVEITEQTEQNDEEIRILTERSMSEGFSIAIDDYGCGYANTSALLRYTPNCVKIDRLLITSLHEDPRKQHFVKNIIEFAHDNHFLALAEGVETLDELNASIALGVDLIQGFYLAKPNLEIMKELPERLVEDILECNRKKDEKIYNKLYVVSKEKELMLTRIGLELYTDILLSGQTITLVGNLDYPTAIKIRVKDNTDTTLTIRNVALDNKTNDVAIDIGENATLTLIIEGDNYINSNGIRVPASSMLRLEGTGNLIISAKGDEAFGIGNDLKHPFGNILMDISGELRIDISGEKGVGIGGCIPGPGAKLMLKGGNNRITGSSAAFVGIGAFAGNVSADISETHLVIDYNVVNGVAIGTPTGSANVRVSNLLLEIKGGGKSITGIGSAAKADVYIEIISAQVEYDMNAPRVIMMGCPLGKAKIYAEHSKVDLFGSGGRVLGAGCADMNGELILRSVGFNVKISSDEPLPLGVKPENRDFGTSIPEIEVVNYRQMDNQEGEGAFRGGDPFLAGMPSWANAEEGSSPKDNPGKKSGPEKESATNPAKNNQGQ